MTRKSVLIVEDEIFVALDLQMTFVEAGWDVAGPFASIEQSSLYLKDHTPTCAVLDVRLIDGEVFPIADVLAERNIPFVFHSGHADGRQLAQRYTASAFCQKPCLPGKLLNELEKLSDRADSKGAGEVRASA